jgi:hypothetical protein
MRVAVLLVGLFLLRANAAGAQEAPDMFKTLPRDHWAYAALEKLHDSGLPITSSKTLGFATSRREWMRYFFAVAVDWAIKAIHERPAGAPQLTPEQVTTLRRLCGEFHQEIMSFKDAGWKTRAEALLGDMQDIIPSFRAVPAGHWAYKAVEDLRRRYVLTRYPDGYFSGKRALSRYGFSIAVDQALRDMEDLRKQGLPRWEPGPRGGQDLIGGVTMEEAASLRRLCTEFKDELSTICFGASYIEALISHMSGAVKPFKDVPAGHWAQPAVDNLRQKSILLGYPDGTFRGTPLWKMGQIGGAAK